MVQAYFWFEDYKPVGQIAVLFIMVQLSKFFKARPHFLRISVRLKSLNKESMVSILGGVR